MQPVDAIAFSWVWMSSSGLDRWTPGFLRNRFTQRWPGPDKHIKSMFRPQRFPFCRVHYPVTDWRVPVAFRDSSGFPHLNYYWGEGDDPTFLLHPKAEAAWINHYFFKSTEEFTWKRWRNIGSEKISESALTSSSLRYFAYQHWSADLVDDDRILRCGRYFCEYYNEFLKINGVPEILQEVSDKFRKKIDSIKTQLLNDPMFNDEDELVQRVLDRLKD